MQTNYHIVDLLLDTAKGFHDIGFNCAAHLKEDRKITLVQRTPVGAVNLAFSAELYLKAIHLLKKKPLTGHKLSSLFNSLDESNRAEIKHLYIQHLENNPDNKLLPSLELRISDINAEEVTTEGERNDLESDLDTFLLKHNQTFEDWRYIHEVSQGGYHRHANFKLFHCFISALQEFIHNHKRGNDMFLTKV